MGGRIVLSNLFYVYYSRVGKPYVEAVKKMTRILKREGIVPVVYVGTPVDFMEKNLLYPDEFRRIFNWHWTQASLEDDISEVTMFEWD